jgi:membrane peptidoglycan carboxypeptidase
MGIDTSPLVEVPSLALGTSPTTLAEMASVYNTIASDGVRHDVLLITSISNADGETIAEFDSESNRVLTEQVARQLTDMLRTAIDEGTGRRIRNQFGIRADVAGKTGTTQNNMDGWFFLMHPDVVAGAWVGFDDPRVTFRSDFWGEGAHNALFIVGDFFREGLRRGQISATPRFADPRYRDRWNRFAAKTDDPSSTSNDSADDLDRDAQDDRFAQPRRSSPGSRGTTMNLRSALHSIGLSIAETARRIGDEWTPEYEPRTGVSDPSVADAAIANADPDERGPQSEMNHRQTEARSNTLRGRNARSGRTSVEDGSNDSSRRTTRRTGVSRDRDASRRTWDDLRKVFDDDRLAILEEKREEYEQLTRKLERRLDQLRSEPATSELERIIRDAYLEERDRNPSLRDLEERLGIRIDID